MNSFLSKHRQSIYKLKYKSFKFPLSSFCLVCLCVWVCKTYIVFIKELDPTALQVVQCCAVNDTALMHFNIKMNSALIYT